MTEIHPIEAGLGGGSGLGGREEAACKERNCFAVTGLGEGGRRWGWKGNLG